MAARQLLVVKELTECSICTEVFTDPRVLPCQHTFCLKCLTNYGNDRRPGDRVPCPLCKKVFSIPDEGLSATQKNFDMEKLLSARKRSAGEEAGRRECGIILCDVCSSEAASSAPRSTVFSVNRTTATRGHTTVKATSSHVLVEIDLHRQLKSDTEKIMELLKKTDGVLPRFEEEKNDLVSRLADIEGEINTAADKLIAAVERDREKLLSEVESIKVKRVKQLETVKQEVEQHVTALKSLK